MDHAHHDMDAILRLRLVEGVLRHLQRVKQHLAAAVHAQIVQQQACAQPQPRASVLAIAALHEAGVAACDKLYHPDE